MSEEKKQTEEKVTETAPIVTEHSIVVNGHALEYTATTGRMPIKGEDGEIAAQMFFIAYTLNNVDNAAERPLTFVFNGGPGSSSVWLHLGALGPKRVKMQDEGWLPTPPYRLEDNPYTWLDGTDLVFIDPIGTGYSRATTEDDNKKFWSLKGDIESVGQFIRLFLSRYGRWSSPLFLAGESYGTTRAGGLSGHLLDKGIALNGIMLISTVLNFQTLHFDRGNDLVYPLFLPSYTATAWYHKQLPEDLQSKPLSDVLAEVEAWAEGDYTLALMKGNRMTDDEREAIVEKLARYTGLSTRFVDHSNLNIHIMRFCKELLRDHKRTVGRLDSRFKGIDAQSVPDVPEHDPSYSAIMPPYTAMINDYVRRTLGYETDDAYEILSFKVHMEWEYERGQYPDTSETLRSAFARNPFMRVLMSQGYYDLATPYRAALYTLAHMDLDDSVRDNIDITYYEAGHMFYLDVSSLAQFKTDVDDFMNTALNAE